MGTVQLQLTRKVASSWSKMGETLYFCINLFVSLCHPLPRVKICGDAFLCLWKQFPEKNTAVTFRQPIFSAAPGGMHWQQGGNTVNEVHASENWMSFDIWRHNGNYHHAKIMNISISLNSFHMPFRNSLPCPSPSLRQSVRISDTVD